MPLQAPIPTSEVLARMEEQHKHHIDRRIEMFVPYSGMRSGLGCHPSLPLPSHKCQITTTLHPFPIGFLGHLLWLPTQQSLAGVLLTSQEAVN